MLRSLRLSAAVSRRIDQGAAWHRYGVAVGNGATIVGRLPSYADDTTPRVAAPWRSSWCDALGALAHAAQRPRRMIGVFVRRALMTPSPEWPGWVVTCPWHPGFPPSAIRSQSGSSTTSPRFGVRRPERAKGGPRASQPWPGNLSVMGYDVPWRPSLRPRANRDWLGLHEAPSSGRRVRAPVVVSSLRRMKSRK